MRKGENHMKKGVYISAVICAVLGFTCISLGTISYYSTSSSGIIKSKTNKFSFDIYHNNKHFETINLYDTIENKTSRNGNVIVPGDSGKFELVVLGTGSEVNISYQIKLTSTNLPSNIKFYLDDKSLEIKQDCVFDGFIKYDKNMTKKHTIYWEWPYDSGENNQNDYDYQGNDFIINISATGIQTFE